LSSKILVIDDSELALEWVRSGLQPMGIEVLTSNTPFGTHKAVLRNQPDLVLLDVGMPGLSGDNLCKILKNNPNTKDIVVILYSSLPEGELAGERARFQRRTGIGIFRAANDGEVFVVARSI